MTISIWLSVILTLVVILAFVSGKFPMSIIGGNSNWYVRSWSWLTKDNAYP